MQPYSGRNKQKIKFLLNVDFLVVTLWPMNQNKLSSRVYTLVKSAMAAAVLPVLVLYIMIAKPDYRIMNALSHVVVPVAQFTGDVVTWPIRAIGNLFIDIRELSQLREENEELRAKLDTALQNKDACDIAVLENKKLVNELDIANMRPQTTVMADVIHDNRAFNHNTLLINRGADKGIEPNMVVMSTDGMLVGVIIDVGVHFSRIRTLIDSDTNIPVRVAGSEVYGFLQGDGTVTPSKLSFSDPEFRTTPGIKLLTSNISGVIPNGIFVGTILDDNSVKIKSPKHLSRVIVMKFDTITEYK